MKMYNQCMLESQGKVQVAWIEKEYAEKNLLITLENEGDEIWKVKEVYNNSSLSYESLNTNRKARIDFANKLK